ncbi:hypothetical protein ACIQXV_08165 [Neobacillus sp. NPDC097160]|uniref:hypothetical protein n=1 Tax=Neobacillus sp. NPDC097160 TaxID=3364298 RepID=UPI00381C813C
MGERNLLHSLKVGNLFQHYHLTEPLKKCEILHLNYKVQEFKSGTAAAISFLSKGSVKPLALDMGI